MRLLNVHSWQFRVFHVDIPAYAIASHRWIQDGEVTLEEVKRKHDADREKSGYKKIEGFVDFVKKYLPHVEWIWVDTCCINKNSDSELSEAINSMYRWYSNAEVCLAYLWDVKVRTDLDGFKQSEWFRRGWTLQELLAPKMVIFLTQKWKVIGHKGAAGRVKLDSGPSLTASIVSATGVPERVLGDFDQSKCFSIPQMLEWAAGRKTTRGEDMSYCLLGMFDVSMPVIYGEGARNARTRLLEAAQKMREGYNQSASSSLPSRDFSDQSQTIINWLSAPDPWTNHASARQRYEPLTGLWLLQSEQYQNWKIGATGHIWLSGKAGCGKTVLCSSVIEDIKRYCKGAIGYAIFYFSFSDASKQSHGDLLRSLVAQLGQVEAGMARLRQSYEKSPQNPPEPHELEEILLLSVKSYDTVFLLLDALDESPEGDTGSVRQDFLDCLKRITEKTPNVKLFTTSRAELDIGASMEAIQATPISIPSYTVSSDIRVYVASEMSRDQRLMRFTPTMKALVEETLSQKADGMFRWAYCQLQELKKLKCTRPSHVKEALRRLPSTLDETYERMLAGIGEEFYSEAFTMLQWLAYARSPPSLGELAEAVLINIEDDSVDTDDRGSLEDTIDILSGLITIVGADDHIREDSENKGWDDEPKPRFGVKRVRENDGFDILDAETKNYLTAQMADRSRQWRTEISNTTKVRLAHYSVKEYLESERIVKSNVDRFYLHEAEGHRFLGKSCLTYLTYYSGSPRRNSIEEDLTEFPMLRYAAGQWFHHCRLQRPGDVGREVSFLLSEDAMRNWLDLYPPGHFPIVDYQEEIFVGTALYYASFLGLSEVAKTLLDMGADVNAFGGPYGNALHSASIEGYEKIVKMLLDEGADVDMSDDEVERYSSTALCKASLFGCAGVVRVLLDAGADVNKCVPIALASRRGDEEVCKMLIDAGADVNPVGESHLHWSPLHEAAFNGHAEIVQMLIVAGADVNALQAPFASALQAASVLCENTRVIQILIDARADVNAEGGGYGSALQTASERGRDDIVQILMDAAAKVNAR